MTMVASLMVFVRQASRCIRAATKLKDDTRMAKADIVGPGRARISHFFKCITRACGVDGVPLARGTGLIEGTPFLGQSIQSQPTNPPRTMYFDTSHASSSVCEDDRPKLEAIDGSYLSLCS